MQEGNNELLEALTLSSNYTLLRKINPYKKYTDIYYSALCICFLF